MSDLIVAAKHVSSHCNTEVSEGGKRTTGGWGTVRQGSWFLSCSRMSLSFLVYLHKANQVRIQTSGTLGWRWPATFFFCIVLQAQGFLCHYYLHHLYPTAATHSEYKWLYRPCWRAQHRQRGRQFRQMFALQRAFRAATDLKVWETCCVVTDARTSIKDMIKGWPDHSLQGPKLQ